MSVVYVHVGLPKTGTTYVQGRLWRNRDLALDRCGLLYPGRGMDDHFHAAAHLNPGRYLDWADPAFADVWPTMVAQMAAWSGTSLISHELYATAGPEQIRRLLADLDFADEVHVVVTVRDLGRQLPSVWQENVKNQRQTSLIGFLDAVRAHRPGQSPSADVPEEPFWEFQDYPRIVADWAPMVGADRIHLVTVPRSGTAAAGDGLWERFLRVLDVDPAALTEPAVRANESLSGAQVEFLRRLNSRLQPEDIEWSRYERIVKGQLIAAMFGIDGGPAAAFPVSERDWVSEQAAEMIDAVAAGGYRVVGDLDDLRPVFGDQASPATANDLDGGVVDAGLDALAAWIAAMPLPERRLTLRNRAGIVVRAVRRRTRQLRR